MPVSHSLTAHSAYIDQLRLLKDDSAAEVIGSIERKARNGRVYLYDRYRLGAKVVSRYLGEATPELEARLARAATLREASRTRGVERARLARLLRSEGYAGLDNLTGSLVTALARIGVFRLGGTLVGTIAFRLYEGELGVRISSDTLAQTGDIDIASFERLSLALGDRVIEDVSGTLAQLEFEPVPSLDPGRTWRWRQTRRETLVEFLTPAFGDEGIRDLPPLGVSAQALNDLDFLIADPIKAAALYRSGVLVQIPRPERFAVHKLIVADRRREGPDALKARKDRAQAAFLVEVLAEERPDELAEAWEDARGRGPRWRERLDRTLARLPETAATLARVAG
jgi:hypothetical protein